MDDDRARMPTTTLYNERKRANLIEGHMKEVEQKEKNENSL
jgi:hypothetical protein